ncbi:MAG: ABC transporter substrate-binding protein [Syntrophomonas sp.]
MKRLLGSLLIICLAAGLLLYSDRDNQIQLSENKSELASRQSGPNQINQKMNPQPNIWIIDNVVSANTEASERGILDGLNQKGLVKGKNCEITIRNAQGDVSTLNTIVDAAIADSPDLVFVINTTTLQTALRKFNQDIPIVFTSIADPVEAGAGKSFTNHAPNVTGFSSMSDFNGMMDFIKKAVPSTVKIGTLFVPGETNSVIYKEQLIKAAKGHGLQAEAVPVNSSSEIANAAQLLCSQKIDVICQISDNLTGASMASIIQIAQKEKIPLFTFISEHPRQGAVAALARDYYQGGKDAAGFGVRILHGESPAVIPFRTITQTTIVINPKAARECGLKLSSQVLKMADQIVGE